MRFYAKKRKYLLQPELILADEIARLYHQGRL